MTYESLEYALQEASRCLGSSKSDEILKGLGWAIYALARQNAPEPRKPTEEEQGESKIYSL
jgi:hypothetical protein